MLWRHVRGGGNGTFDLAVVGVARTQLLWKTSEKLLVVGGNTYWE